VARRAGKVPGHGPYFRQSPPDDRARRQERQAE
jgi:hypothetical protein